MASLKEIVWEKIQKLQQHYLTLAEQIRQDYLGKMSQIEHK